MVHVLRWPSLFSISFFSLPCSSRCAWGVLPFALVRCSPCAFQFSSSPSLSLNSSAHAAVPCATCSRSLTHRRTWRGVLDSDPSGGCHACAAAMGLGGRHGCRRSALLLVQGDVPSAQTPHVGASPGQTPGAPCLGMPCPRCPPLEHKVAAGRPPRFFSRGRS